MKMLITFLTVAGVGCAATARSIPANGTVPLPNGTYSFRESPQGADAMISGKVTILGDSIAVEGEDACPTSYGKDGRSMVLDCKGFKIYVNNLDGRWSLSYAATTEQWKQTQECVRDAMRPDGGFECKQWQTHREQVTVPISGALRLFVIDTAHATTKKH